MPTLVPRLCNTEWVTGKGGLTMDSHPRKRQGDCLLCCSRLQEHRGQPGGQEVPGVGSGGIVGLWHRSWL